MSTFSGQNLFGSGPHKITVQPEGFAQKFSGYSGLNIIANIETYRRLGPATLVDNDGIKWIYVVLGRCQIMGHKKYTGTGVFVQYQCEAIQL